MLQPMAGAKLVFPAQHNTAVVLVQGFSVKSPVFKAPATKTPTPQIFFFPPKSTCCHHLVCVVTFASKIGLAATTTQHQKNQFTPSIFTTRPSGLVCPVLKSSQGHLQDFSPHHLETPQPHPLSRQGKACFSRALPRPGRVTP